jgi:hypothetical protein
MTASDIERCTPSWPKPVRRTRRSPIKGGCNCDFSFDKFFAKIIFLYFAWG